MSLASPQTGPGPAPAPDRTRLAHGRRLLARPAGILRGTRWVFLACGLASLLVTLPPVALGGGPAGLALGLGAWLALSTSWTYGYARDRAPLVLDFLDAAAFAAFAAAGPDPGAVLPVVFAALWFRTTYGTTRRSVLRCVLYLVGMIGGFLLWPLLPGRTSLAPKAAFVPLVLVMFLTVAVGRTLTEHLLAREQSAARDTALAVFGTDLLGMTDAAAILHHAWRTAAHLCSLTPGLRVLSADEDGARLRVLGAEGAFRQVPESLPAAGLLPAASEPAGPHLVADAGELTAAVGVPCAWTAIPLPHAGRRRWVVVGAPGSVPADALVAMQSLTNQVVLALRNTQVHEKLTAQARTDALTGLANRSSFTSALATALASDAAGGTAVLFIDLDDFKNVNDGLGHAAGDDLLREVANRLLAVVRLGDVCARLGGDEFAVLLTGTTAEAAGIVAQRLVETVAAPVLLGEHVATVGASVGLALAGPATGLEELVHRADTAMYAAKAHGKNRVQVFRDGLLHEAGHSFESQLGAAAAGGEMVVHYQPVLSLPELRCTSVEALVRWQHPERGLLLPGDFVAVAERTGAILGIGAYVLRRACADAAGWRRAHPGRAPAVHVNVSAVQLQDEGFQRTVTGCLDEYSLPAGELVLEITETAALSCPAAIGQLQALSARGVRIAVDDFGTGYSALTTLRVLPVDVVKIDKSFVGGSTTNPADAAVIEAVVQMASRLGLTTIAEGVETLEQQRLLEAAGAHSVQGFRYLRPAPVAAFTAWLDAELASESAAPAGAAVLSLTPRRSA